ncbi:uncharacterized protein [Watersipora subatra]|uniref:uncharacterized protein n=1 Tax=Watersipora subatra TaxID=2589382 RepID=UPI00355C7F6C
MSDSAAETQVEPTPTAETPEVAAPEAAESAAAEPESTAAEDKPEEAAKASEEGSEAAKADEATSDDAKPEATKEDESGNAKPEEAVEEAPAPEPIEIPEGNGERVLVTGSTGYLASHIVKQLVESEQYRVRGTVRKIEDNTKLERLKALLGENTKYDVEFVEADLTQPDSWKEAVQDCDYVIHTACPFPTTEPADAEEVINPTRDGTLAVMKASLDSGCVKRVVLTSSIVAINGGKTFDKDTCNEEMWADVDKSPSAYDKGKAIAERAAWDFMKEQVPEGNGMELSVVNPGFIIGPPLMKQDSTSIEVLKKLMKGEMSLMPKISFACVDVRDAALAHIRAMVIKQASGSRHIVCKSSVWLKDMANIMSQEFNSQGFNISTSQASYVVVWLKSHFDQSVKRMLPTVGKMFNFDTKRMSEVLLVEPREVKESLIEMGHSMINLEIVQKLEKREKKAKKMTFRKKKDVEKELEEGEEKKDEPEKAASSSGSAENDSVPDATIEDVAIAIEEPKPAEAEVQEEAGGATAEKHTDEEKEVKEEAAATSDPESSETKEKKEKPKKEKKEKKKGLFSFSFKKTKKPNVEKKEEEAPAASADETPAASADETPAASADETPAASADETPAVSAEEAPAVSAEEATAVSAKEEPAVSAKEAPAVSAEEAPAAEETVASEEPKVATDKTPEPAAEEASVAEETPAAEEKPAAEAIPAAEEMAAAEEKPATEEKVAAQETAAATTKENAAVDEPSEQPSAETSS